jgi:hypothetical protein
MHEHLLSQDILHADEPTLQVLREPGKSAEAQSYHGCTEQAASVHNLAGTIFHIDASSNLNSANL